jgi:transposase
MANERINDGTRDKLVGLLHAGDPHGEVRTIWEAKEALRDLYTHRDQVLATKYFDELMVEFKSEEHPPEVRLLGKTLRSWRSEILAWHISGVTNGPTESMNNLIKRIKRMACGMTNFVNFRIRALLAAGKPNWALLATVQPTPPIRRSLVS